MADGRTLRVTQVVDRSSASPDLPGAIRAGIDASHSGMCKFESSRAPGYPTVSGYLKHFTMDSLGRIALSWDQELARQTQENKLRAMELLGPGICSPPPPPPPPPPPFLLSTLSRRGTALAMTRTL